MTLAITNDDVEPMRAHTATNFGITRLTKKVSLLAIPIVAIVALANLPIASADRFAECMDGCNRIEHELIKLICYTWCALFAE